MRVAGVVVGVLRTLYQKFNKNHAFIYTAVKSDKKLPKSTASGALPSEWFVVIVRLQLKGRNLRRSFRGAVLVWKM